MVSHHQMVKPQERNYKKHRPPELVFMIVLIISMHVGQGEGAACSIPEFPMLIGGVDGDTYFSQIDYSSTIEKFAALFTSQHDTGGLGCGVDCLQPLIVQYSVSLESKEYIKNLNYPHQWGIGIQYSTDASKIIVHTGGQTAHHIIILAQFDGSILKTKGYQSYAHNLQFGFDGSHQKVMLLGSGANAAYIIGSHNFNAWQTTNQGHYMLFKGYIDDSATSGTWTTKSISPGRIKSIQFAESENFIFAYCIEGPSFGEHFIHRIQVCDACPLLADFIVWTISFSITINSYPKLVFEFSIFGSSSSLFFGIGSEGLAKSFGNILSDPSGSILGTTYLEYSNTFVQQSDIKGMKSVTLDIFRLVFYNTITYQTCLGTLVMSTRQLTMMQVVQDTLSPISLAKFIKPTLNDDFVFMSLTSTKFYTVNPLFVDVTTNGKKQSLIHRHNQDHNCQIVIQDPYDSLVVQPSLIGQATDQNYETSYLVLNSAVIIDLGTMSVSGANMGQGSSAAGSSTTVATNSIKTMPLTCTQVPFKFEMPSVRNQVIALASIIQGEVKTFTYPDIVANKICGDTNAEFFFKISPATPGLTVLSANSIQVDQTIASGTLAFSIYAYIEPLQQQMTKRMFTLTVRANTAPYFQTPLVDQTVALGSTKDYNIPTLIDDEGDLPLTVTVSGVSPAYTFITGSFASSPLKIIMNPALNDFSKVGDYNVDFTLSDGYKSQIKTFKVTVTNSPPTFSTTPLDVTVSQGATKIYSLPSYSDPEGHQVTVAVSGCPLFATYDSANKQLSIAPSASESLGSTLVTVSLSDSSLVSPYTFFITVSTAVLNTPPYFTGPPLTDFHVEMFDTKVVNIPTSKDDENDSITVIVKKSDGTILPAFITYTQTQITVAPTSSATTTNVGMWVKDATLTSAIYTFSVIIVNTQIPVCTNPPDFQTKLINVHLKSIDNSISLSCTDPPFNGPIKFQYVNLVTNTIPGFISIPSSTFIIAPTLASEVGNYVIAGAAQDAGGLLSAWFSFNVTVINDFPVFGSVPPMADLNLPFGSPQTFFVPGPVSDTEGHTITINIVKSSDQMKPAWLDPPTALTAWNQFIVDTNSAGPQSFSMLIFLCDELGACGPSYPFNLNILISPTFSCVPNLISTSTVSAPLSLSTNYDFKCTCSDNSIVTLKLYYMSAFTPLPSWIQYDISAFKFVITPDTGSLVGTRNIVYQACNPSNICDTIKTFELSVTNDWPKFVPVIVSLPNPVFILGKSAQQFKVTDPFSDFEGHAITLKLREAGQSTYQSFLSPTGDQTIYDIDTSLAIQGTCNMEIQLCDQFNSCGAVYYFTISFEINWVCDPFPTTLTTKTVHLSLIDTFTLNCASSDSSVIYLKTTQQDQLILPSSVTVNSLTYNISPTVVSDVGTYIIKFFLCNSPSFTYCSLTSYLWTLIIVNNPPVFDAVSPFFNNRIINHMVSTIIDINAPTSDYEQHTRMISLIDVSLNMLPGFITQIASTNTYTVYAQLPIDVKVHQMQAKVQDQFGEFSTISFTITVQNLPPQFEASVPTIWQVTLGDSIVYNAYDPENLAFSLSVTPSLSFLTVNPTQVILSPTSSSQLGTQNVAILLTDSFGETNIPSKQIIITNSVPYFKTIIPSFEVQLGQTTEIKFPIAYDSDPLHTVSCTYAMQNPSLTSMPSFITGYTQYSYIAGIGRICSIQVNPDSSTFLGTHLMKIKLSDSYEEVAFNFEIKVINNELPNWFIPQLQSLNNIGPPIFGDKETTSYLSIIAENQFVYKFPSISDPDEDDYKLIVELGEAIAFVEYKLDHQYNKLSFVFNPKKADAKSDQYLIKLSLVDQNIFPKSSQYQLYLSVLDSTSFGNQLNATFNNQSISTIQRRVITDKLRIAPELSARIRKITYSGLVTIRFTEPLIIPQNFTQFNNEILELRVIPGVIDAEEYLKRLQQEDIESWNITKFSSQEMEIQVVFVNPSEISSSVIMEDSLQVKFLSNGHFLRSIDQKAIRLNYTIQSKICKQIVYSDSIKRVEKIAQILAQSLIYMFTGNLVLQFFLSQIMHKMWSLMNTLQLMSFSLKFALSNVPDNLFVFFETITDFRELKASFKEKAQQYLQEKVFKISDSFDQKIQKNLYGMENNTDNDGSFIIDNLGIIVLAAIAIFGLILLGSVIYVLNKKFESVRKILGKVQDKIFWNVGLRFLVQSYFKLILVGLNTLLIIDFTTKSKSINTLTGLLHALFAFLFPVSVHIFLTKSALRISSDESFSSKCNSLFLKLDEYNPIALLHTPIFLYRRLIFAILIVFMHMIPGFQIQIACVISFATLYFILKVRPMAEPMLNFMEAFNETMLILFVSFLPALTNYQPEPHQQSDNTKQWEGRILANSTSSLADAMKKVQIKPKSKRQTSLMTPDEQERNDNVGWILLGIVGVYLTVNILSLVGSVGWQVFKKIKHFCAKKTQQQKKEDISNCAEIQSDKCAIQINDAVEAHEKQQPSDNNNENPSSYAVTRSPLILQEISGDQNHQRVQDQTTGVLQVPNTIMPEQGTTEAFKKRRIKKKKKLPLPVMNDNEINYLNMGVFNPSYQGKKESLPVAKPIEKKKEEVYQIRQIIYEEEEKKTKHNKKKSKQQMIVPQEEPVVNMRNLQINVRQHAD